MRLKLFREAFTTLFIGLIGSLGAGIVLSGMSQTFALIPGLAILLPGALGARGTIHGALGAKLSSALHLGLIKHPSWHHRLIQENARITHKATLFISLSLAFIASGLAKVSGIPANPFLLFFISVASGALAGIVLIILTNVIAFQAFRRGWDPDIISAPLIATIGDFITVPILFGVARLGLLLPHAFLGFLFVLGTITILWEVRRYVLTARFLILPISIVFQTFAGIFLERSVVSLLAIPAIFIFLPAFLAQGGNLASFVASRLATQLHLGTLTPEFTIRGNIIYEMLNVVFLSILIFPLLGLASFLLQGVIGTGALSLIEFIRIAIEAGFLNTILVAIGLSFTVSIISWRLNLDPDDVTIPILSGVADFFGILFLLLII